MRLTKRSFPLQAVSAFSARSDHTGHRYDITVGLPHTYDELPDRTFGALLVLDGHHHFSSVNMLARTIALEIRDLIVVGVDAPIEDTVIARERKRVHQFTPACEWPMTDVFGRNLKNYIETDLDDSKSVRDFLGGAGPFLAFLREELLPAVQSQYRIDADDIGLIGNSAAGFFTACVLFDEASPFETYVISSPAMAYGDGEVFRIEERWASTHTDLPAKVYMGAGGLELHTIYYEGRGQIVSGMSRLTGGLHMRDYANLQLWSEVYSGVGHIDSLFPTVAAAMRRYYPR